MPDQPVPIVQLPAVYVLVQHERESSTILGVFSTREIAERAIKPPPEPIDYANMPCLRVYEIPVDANVGHVVGPVWSVSLMWGEKADDLVSTDVSLEYELSVRHPENVMVRLDHELEGTDPYPHSIRSPISAKHALDSARSVLAAWHARRDAREAKP